MKKICINAWLISIALTASIMFASAGIPIIISKDAAEIELLAANELRDYLDRLYPLEEFTVTIGKAKTKTTQVIYLGTSVSMPKLIKYVDHDKLKHPESYVVTNSMINGQKAGLIIGADCAGVLYGIYGLLEQLGCGFYISGDTYPPAYDTFDLGLWNLADHPLVPVRLVNNWGGTLTGSTIFELNDWQNYIRQSQKMGYNTIMVHGYANDPIFTFTFNGVTKKVDRVPSTLMGRNWGTEHFNDVRRLPGGFVFDEPVHGSSAAKTMNNYVEAQQSLMSQVFIYAKKRGFKIYFMLDIDTPAAIPQDVVKTLPESARFRSKDTWYPKLDTPEAYGYFKAQMISFCKLYPQVDRLVLTMRGGGGQWDAIKPTDLPESMQADFKTFIRKNADALELDLGSEQDVNIGTEKVDQEKMNSISGRYISSLVHQLYQRALKEVAGDKIDLALASWRSSWISITVSCESEETKHFQLIPFDWDTRFDNSFMLDKNKQVLAPAKGRLIPMIWPNHDDGRFLGAPFKPFDNFADLLDDRGCNGFGILHWFERPHDLFFKNQVRQVWNRTRNEPVDTTRLRLSNDWFGQKDAQSMTGYLKRWEEKTPRFGRLHGPNQYYAPWKEGIADPMSMVAECLDRLAFLNTINVNAMSYHQQAMVSYFKAMEEFLIAYGRADTELYKANKFLADDNWDHAKEPLTNCNSAAALEAWGHMSRLAGGNLPEQTYLLQIYSHWHATVLAGLQKAGLNPIRINFGHTFVESENIGNNNDLTYFLDRNKEPWIVSGNTETKLTVVDVPSGINAKELPENIDPDVFKLAVKIEDKGTIPIRLFHNYDGGWKAPGKVRPGSYRCRLWVSSDNDHSTLEVSNRHKKASGKHPVPSGRISEINFNMEFPESFDSGEPVTFSVSGGHILVYGLELTYLTAN